MAGSYRNRSGTISHSCRGSIREAPRDIADTMAAVAKPDARRFCSSVHGTVAPVLK